jgi:hypothetical protein
MNRTSFETYADKVLTPALKPGQFVVADTLSSHKSPHAVELLTAKGCEIIFLPPYSPELNPIEIIRAIARTNGAHALIFAKRKTLIRKAAARTYQDLWNEVGQVCDLFPSTECSIYFTAAGYGCT